MTTTMTDKNNIGDMTTLEAFNAKARIKDALDQKAEEARIRRASNTPLLQALRLDGAR